MNLRSGCLWCLQPGGLSLGWKDPSGLCTSPPALETLDGSQNWEQAPSLQKGSFPAPGRQEHKEEASALGLV